MKTRELAECQNNIEWFEAVCYFYREARVVKQIIKSRRTMLFEEGYRRFKRVQHH